MSTPDNSIPPYRDLPQGRLAERRRRLLAEIALQPRRAFPVRRVALLAGAGACAAAGAAAIVLALSDASSRSTSPFLVQAIHSPVWSVHSSVDWGGRPCTALVEVVFGCKGVFAVPAAAERQLPAVAATTEVRGGSTAQRKLLRSIIGGMEPTAIARITIESSRSKVTLRMSAVGAPSETYWQEALVAAAFRDRSAAARRPVTVALKGVYSNGALLPPRPAIAPPRAKAGDVRAARQRLEAAAEKIGVPLEALTVYRPDGVAVSAVLEADNPAPFLVHAMPDFLAAMGDPWHDYDGVYIRLVDGSGATVWETSTVVRMSEGSVGARQDLAGCSPVADFGPTPPPCPAR